MKLRLALLLLIVVAAYAIPVFARPVVIHESGGSFRTYQP